MQVSMINLLDGQTAITATIKEAVDQLGPRALDQLIVLMTDKTLFSQESKGSGQIPLLAAKLLAEMNMVSALQPMIQVWAGLDPLSTSHTELETSIGKLGASHLEDTLKLYETIKESSTRQCFSSIFKHMKIRDERIFNIHLECLKEGFKDSPQNLIKYGDPKAIPFLSERLDQLLLSETIFLDMSMNDLVDAIERLGGSLTKEQNDKISQARRQNDKLFGNFKDQLGMSHLTMTNPKSKLGRNDACDCGSGKKYKKCCLNAKL